MTAQSPGFFKSTETTESTRTQTLATLKKDLEQHFKTQNTPINSIRSIYIQLPSSEQAPQQGTQHLFKPLPSHNPYPFDLDEQMRNGLIEGIARHVALQKLPRQALHDLLDSLSKQEPSNGAQFTI
jgi:hypothetical protein